MVEVQCASPSLDFEFLSGIDQAEADESWAFSSVTVIGSTGEEVLLDEVGAAIVGWTNEEVTDVGSAGNVHGPWGNDVTDVSIVVEVPEDVAICEVSWRSWGIDSRDGEVDSVRINGEEVWAMALRYNEHTGWEQVRTAVLNLFETIAWNGGTVPERPSCRQGPSDFPNPWGDSSNVWFDMVTVEVPCTSPSMELQFLSGIDQDENDESWAFSDVRVVGRPEAGGALECEGGYDIDGACYFYYEEEADADGWSNGEITHSGSSGLVHGHWGNEMRGVSREIAVPAGVTECTISWTSWAMGSRDGEADSLYVNDEQVWTLVSHYPHQSCVDGWETAPDDFPMDNSYGGACFVEVTVEAPCAAPSMVLRYHSDIDEGEGNEGWGFSHVEVSGQ
eukprot:SAG11_NODE_2638_length_3142_cov_17.327637_4_plen_391_part_00